MNAPQLRPYQKIGCKWLSVADRILGDSLGLGKGVQAIGGMRLMKAQTALIVSTRSMLREWAKELDKWWAPDGPIPQPEVTYSTFDGLTRLLDTKQCWDLMIVDEAHKVKNRKSKRRKSVAALKRRCTRVWLLTATPLLNRVDELWSVLNLVAPERFGSFWKFVKEHAEAHPGRFGWEINPAPTDPARLANAIAPYFLRREREAVSADLPPVDTIELWVPMTPQQSQLHERLSTEVIVELGNGTTIINPNTLASITRMRQCAISPQLLGDEEPGGKIEVLLDLLESVGDKPIVVWSQWERVLDLMGTYFTKANYKCGLYTGKLNAEPLLGKTLSAREQLVKRWEEGDFQVLLATMACAGEGLNLTHADVAVFTDLYWTPSGNDQPAGRLDPTRQPEDNRRRVVVYHVLSEDSVERWVHGKVGSKREIIDSIYNECKVKLS